MEDARLGRPTGRRAGARRCWAPNSATPSRCCEFAASEVVPRLARTTDEIDHILHALDGGYVAGGSVGLADARAGQRAADRPQLLLRRPEGDPVAG